MRGHPQLSNQSHCAKSIIYLPSIEYLMISNIPVLSDLFKLPALVDPASMEWERLRPDDDSVAGKTKLDNLYRNPT